MCIIIAKDKKGRLPSYQELKNSFEYNSDGAGFMYVDNGKVIIDKGYMTFETFINHYYKLTKKYNDFKDKSLVIHCRIGTSGKNIKGNTHPYPITNDETLLRTKKLKQNIGIVHNGIIHGFGTAKGLNDTQEFIKTFIYPIYSVYKTFYKNKDLRESIEKMTSSKFAILDTNDDIYYIGDFIDDNGLNFSNTTYKLSYYSYYPTNWYHEDRFEKDYAYEEEYISKNDYLEDNLIPLYKNWYVDINGSVYMVGDKDYWYDLETLDLYELRDDEFCLLSKDAYIYDENYELVY